MAILTNKGRGKITADHLLLALEDLADMSGVDFEILERMPCKTIPERLGCP